ncbi:MAG: hypothetical protein KBD39_01285 [Sterolibacterium sp.]|nr:hypothetical protein [Sterolibacterium sp.]MBP9798742.1 hypothetical protein [Sterolibacterium sp.]
MNTELEKHQDLDDNRTIDEVQPSEPTPGPLSATSPSVAPATISEAETASESDKPTKALSLKTKQKIESLEQFIEHAYSNRRGQPVKLDLKLQNTLDKQPDLNEAAKERLLNLFNGDSLLRVSRQLLLASKEITDSPKLRAVLKDFVKMAMLRHPAFESERVKAALQNLPDTRPIDAMKVVAVYEPAAVEGTEPLKPADLEESRRNAVNLLAAYFALDRGLGPADLTNLLFIALWDPAQQKLNDDTERLRALTDIGNTAGTGVAVQCLRQQLKDSHQNCESAESKTTALKQQVMELQSQCDQMRDQLEKRTAELEDLRVSSAQELAALCDDHDAGRMQQGHEFESLRGRLIQRLEECNEMLDTGLNALRKESPSPRVSVMIQRTEVVLDTLRDELNNLREG